MLWVLYFKRLLMILPLNFISSRCCEDQIIHVDGSERMDLSVVPRGGIRADLANSGNSWNTVGGLGVQWPDGALHQLSYRGGPGERRWRAASEVRAHSADDVRDWPALHVEQTVVVWIALMDGELGVPPRPRGTHRDHDTDPLSVSIRKRNEPHRYGG